MVRDWAVGRLEIKMGPSDYFWLTTRERSLLMNSIHENDSRRGVSICQANKKLMEYIPLFNLILNYFFAIILTVDAFLKRFINY